MTLPPAARDQDPRPATRRDPDIEQGNKRRSTKARSRAAGARRCDRDLFVFRRRDIAIGRKRGDRRTSMPLPDRTCAVIQLRTSGWFHSPVAMDKIPSYPVTLLPCIATSLRAWRPHSSLKARTERWTERTLITIIAQLHPRQSLLCRLSLLCSTALRTIVMTRADSSSLESTKVRIRHEAS